MIEQLNDISAERQEKELYFELGQLLTRQNKFRKAVNFLLEAKHTEGGRPAEWLLDYWLGKVYAKLNKTEDAITSFLTAAVASPDDKQEIYAALHVLLATANPEKFIDCVNHWTESNAAISMSTADNRFLEQLKQKALILAGKIANGNSDDTNEESADLLRETEDLIRTFQYKDALQKAELGLSHEPHNTAFLFLKIRILIEGQIDLKGAIALFNDAEFGYVAAMGKEHVENQIKALAEAENANANTLFLASTLGNEMGLDVSTVETWLQQAGNGLKNDNEFPLLGLYLLSGKIAERKADKPEAFRQYFEAAKCYYWLSAFSEAAKYFDACIELQAEETEPYVYNADVYLLLSSQTDPPYNDPILLQKALGYWQQAPQKAVSNKTNAWYYLVIARVHEALAKFVDKETYVESWKTILYAERMLVHERNDAGYWGYSSRFFKILDLECNAVVSLKMAETFDASDGIYEEQKILLQLGSGDFDEAEKSLTVLKEKDAGTGQFYRSYHYSWEGYMRFRQGKIVPDAITLLDQSIALAPNDLFARQLKMLAFWHISEYVHAKEEAQALLEQEKKFAYGDDVSFAWADFILGNTAKAVARLEKETRRDRYARDNSFNLVQFYLYNGDISIAKSNLNKFINATGNNNLLDELRVSLSALSSFAHHEQPAKDQVAMLDEAISDCQQRIEKKMADNNLYPLTAMDELRIKQEDYAFESGTVPAIAIAAARARLLLMDADTAAAIDAYRGLLSYKELFPEAEYALNYISNEKTEETIQLIQTGAFADAIETAQFVDTGGSSPIPVQQALLALAAFGKGDESTLESALTAISNAGLGNKSVIEQFLQTLTSIDDQNALVWRLGRFIEDRCGKDPAHATFASYLNDHFWNKVINYKNTVPYEHGIIMIEISKDLIMPGDPNKDWKVITEFIPAFRKKMLDTLGIRLPTIRISDRNAGLEDGRFIILLNDLPTDAGQVFIGKIFVSSQDRHLLDAGIATIEGWDPSSRQLSVWVDDAVKPLLDEKQINYWHDPYQYIIAYLETVLQSEIEVFVDTGFTGEYLFMIDNNVEPELYALAQPIRGSENKLFAFTKILKNLVKEGVSIGDKATIIRAFDAAIATTDDENQLLVTVRLALRETLPHNHAAIERAWLPAELEQLFEASVFETEGKQFLAFTSENGARVEALMRETVTGRQGMLVLVTKNPRMRLYVRRVADLVCPTVHIASEAELT